MPFYEPPLCVSLVPASSAVRARLQSAVAAAGLKWAERAEHAALVVGDFTQATAPEPVAATSSLTALVVAGSAWKDHLEALRPSEVISVDAPEEELVYRLKRVGERHHERTEQRQRQKDLTRLVELTADYAECLDIETLLHDVTRKLAEEMNIARAALVVLDPERDHGVIVAASDDATLRNLRIELSRYPEIREVVRTGKPVIVEDAPTHPLLEGVKVAVAARGIHAIAALPLHIRGEVLGVLLLRAAGERKGFSPREIDFLTTVAHATAVALRNATLVQTVRGQTEVEKNARIAAEARAADLQRYHSFFANVSEGVAILDEEGHVLSLNPSGANILGVSPEEARGCLLNALTRPTDEPELEGLVRAASRGETRTDVDLVIRPQGGRRLTLSLSAAPLQESSAATILSFRDVTLARKLANELRQTKDFLEQLIDSSVDAIIAADMRGRMILFNKGAETITGYSAADALQSLHVRELYEGGVAEQVMDALRATEHGGVGRLAVCRQEIITRTGERVPVNMTASILYEGGREIATVGIFTDLRDRMQLEQKLSDAEIRLEQSEKNAVIVALAGTAAHELNQPLTSVMGYAELLRRKLNEGDAAWRPVDIIYREAERMAEIVRKIGKITRYETKAYIGAQQILDLDKASSHED